MATKGIVKGIVSNLVTVEVDGPVSQNEICYISVGGVKLMAEVIKVIGKNAFVQVFESTRGMRVGDEAEFQGHMLEVTLGPGMLSRNYDGLQNDLDKMQGVFLKRGEYTFPLDSEKKWAFKPLAKVGDRVGAGDWLGEVDENSQPHKIMVPFTFQGTYTVKEVAAEGAYTINDTMAVLTDANGAEVKVTMVQKWPVKRAITCYREKPRPFKLLETGVRTIDTVNPIVEGGTGFIPGPFGTGKTVLQHAISKQAEADIVIIAACGERANEVVEIFTEFPELVDPHTGRKLMERTIIIANTSNMPVAAREASIYTGITLAEYYRDMGYHTALMADSTSRWAEALREISGRLEEMPADEGFPAYLPSRLSEFYERSGYVENLNSTEGSITLIGAVSPQGSDFSEPVTQNTKRFTRCFWALDKSLAYARHYPAINWNLSYSEYIGDLSAWFRDNIAPDFTEKREEICSLLLEENSLMEIVKLIGSDVLPDDQKLIIETARVIRVGFLQQNAFHKDDTFVPLEKQYKMMDAILHLYHRSKEVIARQIPISKILATGLFDRLVQMKYDVPNDKLSMIDDCIKDIDVQLDLIMR